MPALRSRPGRAPCVSLNVNTLAAGSTIGFFDGTSTAGKLLGTFSGAAAGQTLINLAFVNGLFVVITDAPNVTVGFQ